MVNRSATEPQPYRAGAVLGASAAIAVALVGHPLGASGAYLKLSGFVAARFFPHAMFWNAVVTPAFDWSCWLLVGVFVGALLARRLREPFRFQTMPEAGWTERFGPRPVVRWAIGFLGAALVQFGAGIAGGCTSGLGISGGIVLAPAAFVFMAAMFVGGIPTAALVVWFASVRRRGLAAGRVIEATP